MTITRWVSEGTCGFTLSWLLGAAAMFSPTYLGAEEPTYDGVVVEVTGERLKVKLGEHVQAQAGDVVFLYRYYDHVPDLVWGETRSGHTWLGRAKLVEVGGGSAVVLSPLVDAVPGDYVEVVEVEVAATVASSGWVAQGEEKKWIAEPFLVQRRLDNRIQITTDYVRLDPPDPVTGIGDAYVGTTIDFTFWPETRERGLKGLESMRFGAGGFQGESAYSAELSETGDPLVRFLFGFTELDFALTSTVGVLPSLKLGLNNSGFGAGAGMRFRLGSAQNSHILAGAEYTSGVGGKAGFEVHHFPSAISQVWLSTSIENLPSGTDRWGGRILVGVERHLTPNWWLSLAVGMSGRGAINNDKPGPTGMLGVSYNFDTGK